MVAPPLPPEAMRLKLLGGPIPVEDIQLLYAFIQSAIPKEVPPPTGVKYRPREFPDEVMEALLDDVKQDSASNATREAQWQQRLAESPLAPDEYALETARLEQAVRTTVADYVITCGPLKVKVKQLAEPEPVVVSLPPVTGIGMATEQPDIVEARGEVTTS